ncbi:hypothetical protein MOTE_02800 [Moorella thermoacetica]|uniref:Uncharacterized protein n=1 Tax=Neomoorella thermoacetica TaxID=1525 RepID=A0A1J5P130_NEOTH|nr:hypothetical protein MOTE_02800 [Moorella thermoacetica]
MPRRRFPFAGQLFRLWLFFNLIVPELADFAGSLEEAKEVRFTGRNNLAVTINLEKEDFETSTLAGPQKRRKIY